MAARLQPGAMVPDEQGSHDRSVTVTNPPKFAVMTSENRSDQDWWGWYIGSDEHHASFMHRKLQEVMPDARIEWYAFVGVRGPSDDPDSSPRYAVLTRGP